MVTSPRQLGVLMPNWIGDAVMATPALASLRDTFPDARLIGVMRPQLAEVLAGHPWFDDVILFNRRAKQPERRAFAVAKQLRARQLDTLLLFPNSFSSAALGWLSGAKRRVGFGRGLRSWLLTDSLSAPRDGRRWRPRSAVDHYLDIVRVIGCQPSAPRLRLALRPEDEQGAALAWKNFGWEPTTPVLLLNTGSANGAARNWPTENFVELARRTIARSNWNVLALCGPAELPTAKQIEDQAAHPRIRSMAEQDLSLGVMKGCIARGHVMVTTDSGPRHIAAALDVPTVTLSGPIDPRWSHNYHKRDIVLRRDVPCSPCGKKICPLEHHCCMKEITVDQVLTAILRVDQRSLDRAA